MTTFTGSFVETLTFGQLPNLVASRPARPDPHVNGFAIIPIGSPTQGVLTKHQPTSLLKRTLNGVLQRSFLNDFYFQIYYIPSSIAFGFVGTPTTIDTIIWNSNFVNETIESTALTGFDGLTLNMPTLPYTMRALAYHTISVTASLAGPIIIDGVAQLDFSPATFTPPLDVTGTRADLWPLSIDWAKPVTVTLEYKTDIIKSRNENEMRRALRQTPRKTIEFLSTAMSNDDTVTLHQFLATTQPITVIVPEPGCRAYTSAAVLSTDTTLTFTTIPLWMLEGCTLRIDFPGNSTVNDVVAIDTDTGVVTVASELGTAAPAGLRVVALRQVNLANSLNASRVLRITAAMTNKYEVVPASEPVYTPSAATTFYLGIEVFLTKPDWSKAVEETFDWDVEVIDYTWGVHQRFVISPRQIRTVKMQFWDKGANKCLLIADFFYRMMGMQGQFFMPTFDNDMPLRTGILAGQNTLRVIGSSLNDAILNGFPIEHLAVKMTDGTYFFRAIISASVITDSLGTDTLVEVDSTMTLTPLSSILMVSWMPVWRFATDQLVMEWQSDDVGIATVAVRTLVYESGSTP